MQNNHKEIKNKQKETQNYHKVMSNDLIEMQNWVSLYYGVVPVAAGYVE